ncbi:RidA family protein [Gorillibacterium timonense]|uniref:RidA family protein n=1 Tax=Gorillibacterium timonense TaxID=1689269 RepID=UPI00071CBFA8|nr:RidA family protein [Gorillibacterium timonense]
MKTELIATTQAPAAIGPYSQAVRFGNLLFTSGQIALTPAGEFVQGGIDEETRQVFQNLQAILEAAGAERTDVIKATVFLQDMEQFGRVNAIYGEFFGEHKPARSTVQVAALPRGAQVEIELIVALASE